MNIKFKNHILNFLPLYEYIICITYYVALMKKMKMIYVHMKSNSIIFDTDIAIAIHRLLHVLKLYKTGSIFQKLKKLT